MSRGCPQGGLLSGPALWNGDKRDLKIHSTDREIFADYTFQEYNTASAGIVFSFN